MKTLQAKNRKLKRLLNEACHHLAVMKFTAQDCGKQDYEFYKNFEKFAQDPVVHQAIMGRGHEGCNFRKL